MHPCGGPVLAGELLDEADELVVKTYPIVRGAGLPVFGAGFSVTESALGVGAYVRERDAGAHVRQEALDRSRRLTPGVWTRPGAVTDDLRHDPGRH